MMLESQKKVFIFSSVHPWNDTRIFHKQAVSLAENNYEVHVYAVASESTYDNTIPNITVHTFAKRGLPKRRTTWREILDIITNHQPDYIHLHDPELLTLVRTIKKTVTGTVLFDMHENFPAALASKKIAKFRFPKIAIPAIRRWEHRALKQADAVIFAEESYKAAYKKLLIKQVDILNYPHLNTEPPKLENPSTPLIIYAGAIHEVRGLHEMLATATALRDRGHTFELAIIGKIPERLALTVETYIFENKLESCVKLLGRMDLKQVNQYYAKATIGLALLHPEPNYLGSIATKMFEYMSFGLPFVASNFPLWEKFVTESGSGITANPTSVSDITAKIEMLLKDPTKRAEIAKQGRKAHQETYNWERESKKLCHLYAALGKE